MGIVRKSPELDIPVPCPNDPGQAGILGGTTNIPRVLRVCSEECVVRICSQGHCHDLQKRIVQHNSGMTKSIRPYLPFELVYFEEFETELES